MAEKKTKAKQNSIRIVGFLKENNLEKVQNKNGDDVIRGSITIGTDDKSSHKVQFYIASKTKDGDDSKDYDNFVKLLPSNTVSVASFLKDNPGTKFEDAQAAASKIWVMARLEEYASRSGERTRSMVTIKGFRAGFKEATDSSPYNPCAEFTCDVFIEDMKPETTGDEETGITETGRLIITGLMPMYDKSMQRIEFVAPVEDGVADYIKAHYAVTDTVTLKGDLVSIMTRVLKEADSSEYFGKASDAPQYETTFTRERRVLGGSANSIPQGKEGCIATADVKSGLVLREEKMVKNGEKAAANNGGEAKSDLSKKGFGNAAPEKAVPTANPSFSADLDF